jgi:hypothetical protein
MLNLLVYKLSAFTLIFSLQPTFYWLDPASIEIHLIKFFTLNTTSLISYSSIMPGI